MSILLEHAMLERVEKGAGFLDRHYPGWWQHMNLGTLDIASCQECVLGQVYGMAPESERGQVVSQAVQYLKTRGLTEDEAQVWMETDSNFVLMTQAHEELQNGGAIDHGFSWDPFMEEKQGAVLTEMWVRLVIQRRLDAHADVVLEFSKLDRIEKELVNA